MIVDSTGWIIPPFLPPRRPSPPLFLPHGRGHCHTRAPRGSPLIFSLAVDGAGCNILPSPPPRQPSPQLVLLHSRCHRHARAPRGSPLIFLLAVDGTRLRHSPLAAPIANHRHHLSRRTVDEIDTLADPGVAHSSFLLPSMVLAASFPPSPRPYQSSPSLSSPHDRCHHHARAPPPGLPSNLFIGRQRNRLHHPPAPLHPRQSSPSLSSPHGRCGRYTRYLRRSPYTVSLAADSTSCIIPSSPSLANRRHHSSRYTVDVIATLAHPPRGS